MANKYVIWGVNIFSTTGTIFALLVGALVIIYKTLKQRIDYDLLLSGKT